MFQTDIEDKIKTHFLYSVILFWESCLLWENVEKYGTGHALCIPDE